MLKFLYAPVLLFVSASLVQIGGWLSAAPNQEDSSTIFFNERKTTQSSHMLKKHVIYGAIRPKSVSHSSNGLFFAQNMMYRHTITVYDRKFNLVKTIKDRVRFSDYGMPGDESWHQGSPVEASFSPDGLYAWVANYKMYGTGFDNPGKDNCQTSGTYDNSFLYKINLSSLEIEDLIEVGSVPKNVAAAPDGKTVLVSNWCSGDLSVVDTELGMEIDRIYLGDHPSGIVIDAQSRYAYVSVMDEDKIAVIKLSDNSVSWLYEIGTSPRSLQLGPSDRFLYVSLGKEGKVGKIDLSKRKIVAEATVGKAARGMALSPKGKNLYVVNYLDNTFTKIKTDHMTPVETVSTNDKPIGITFDEKTHQVWVACYTGSIMIFEDKEYLAVPASSLSINEIGPLPPAPSATQEPLTLNTLTQVGPKKENPNYYIAREEIEGIPETKANSPVAATQIDEPIAEKINVEEKKPALIASAESPQPKNSIALEEPVRERTRAIPVEKASNVVQKYYIIVGSFSDKVNAEKYAKKLVLMGYSPRIFPFEDNKYRVSADFYHTHEGALEAKKSYKARHKVDAWILAE